MSNIFNSDNINTDLINFKKEIFNTNQIEASSLTTDLPSFKKYHKLLYTLALIQYKVSVKHNKNEHKFVFLKEIQSDLLMFIPLLFQGFKNSALIHYRKIIENFYNHIFYFDHKIEFEKLNNGKNEYTPILSLKEYLNSYPSIKNDKNIKAFNEHIFTEYTELNKVVHSKGIDFMSLSNNLKEIKKEIDFENTFENINELTYRVIYILFKFHTDFELTNTEKKTISSSIPKKYRSELFE